MSDGSGLLALVCREAESSGRFHSVFVRNERLECEAEGSAAPAHYRVVIEAGRPWVSLVMADRWQSESIETDLLHSGDTLEELLEEELAELGESPAVARGIEYQHFRSDDKLFTFRTPVPVAGLGAAEAAARVSRWLLAYEACFRGLGDMSGAEDE